MSQAIHAFRRPILCNDALATPLNPTERASMIAQAAKKLEELFTILQIDYEADQHTRDTPRRVAKMFVEEIFSGRYVAPPKITDFEAASSADGLIITGPIVIRSTCAHHLMPIYGHAYVGILPDREGRIIGLSKYDRIIDHFASRPQIQEELARQIGDYLHAVTSPRGLGVRISAVHMCKTHRGVRASHQSRMVSTVFHGEMQIDKDLKQEFLQECLALERTVHA